jgi:hypothetical protein
MRGNILVTLQKPIEASQTDAGHNLGKGLIEHGTLPTSLKKPLTSSKGLKGFFALL